MTGQCSKTLRIMSPVERGWVAGLIEGEGCIRVQRSGKRRPQPVVTLAMTDEDVVLRLQAVTGLGDVRPRPIRNPAWQDQFVWRISGVSQVQELLREIRPLLGDRRGAATDATLVACAEMLESIEQRKRFCVRGHERAQFGYRSATGNLMCRPCKQGGYGRADGEG